ncbi:MAG: ribosomal L7Ae/L30e/S12e/Gadd45 family protein [Conexivisphaera sp.]
MKEYVRSLSDFMQVVRRTGGVEYGLRGTLKHVGSARLVVASNGLAPEEVARLEDSIKDSRGILVHFRDITPAELGRAVGRQHPVKALAVIALGDADLDRFLDSIKGLEESGALRMVRASRRR